MNAAIHVATFYDRNQSARATLISTSGRLANGATYAADGLVARLVGEGQGYKSCSRDHADCDSRARAIRILLGAPSR
jgi:hypothetical protein